MKKYWPFLALAVGVALWLGRPEKNEPEEFAEMEVVEEEATPLPQPKPEKKSTPPPEPIQRAELPKSIAQPLIPQVKPGVVWPELPSKSVVRFEVIGGHAVAFGDIVVGRVRSNPGKSQYGIYEPKASKLWPSNKIPYLIDKNLTIKAEVEKAIQYFEDKTVIDFVPATDEKNLLVFTTFEKNCASYLGMTGGQQPIFLSPDCKRDEIVHELMHALGFIHEQSREDRDRYIEVLYDNIDPKFVNQYDIVPDFVTAAFRGSVFHFDYDSIMMYLPTAFALEPGLPTMRSLTHTQIPKQKTGLRPIDIERLYYLYGQ